MQRVSFPIRISRRYRPLLLLWGVTRGRALVRLGADLDVRFGFFRFRAPLAEIATWRIEGPFVWIGALGVRRSIRHGDFTFGGSAHGGVRMDFRHGVRWGPFSVPAVYVTVDDLEGLARALEQRGIPGTDVRKRRAN